MIDYMQLPSKTLYQKVLSKKYLSAKMVVFLSCVMDRLQILLLRCGSRAAATSKIEHFVIIVNGFQSLTIITKHSILDFAAALDPLLLLIIRKFETVS